MWQPQWGSTPQPVVPVTTTGTATADSPSSSASPTIETILQNNDKSTAAAHEDSASTDSSSGHDDAQQGVRDIEATTTVWNKKWIVIAYLLIVSLGPFIISHSLMHNLTLSPTHTVDHLLCRQRSVECQVCPDPLRHQRVLRAQSDGNHVGHELAHWRSISIDRGQDSRHLGSASRLPPLCCAVDARACHDGCLPKCGNICCCPSVVCRWVSDPCLLL